MLPVRMTASTIYASAMMHMMSQNESEPRWSSEVASLVICRTSGKAVYQNSFDQDHLQMTEHLNRWV